MPQTDVDVCNQAIRRVGGDEIEALNDDTPLSAYCLTNYPDCRAWLLSGYRWTFATRVVQLQRRAETPSGCPLDYGFDGPGDLVGAIHAYRDGARETDCPVRVLAEADFLASDAPAIWAEYTAAVPEARWPPAFARLVATTLAVDLARHLQQENRAKALFVEAFGTPDKDGKGGLYATAREEDSRMAPQRTLTSNWDPGPLVGVRFASGLTGLFGGTIRVENA